MLTINLTVTAGHTECRQESASPSRMRQFQLLEPALLREPPAPYAAVNSRDERGGKSSTAATIEPFRSS